MERVNQKTIRQNRTICLPILRKDYSEQVMDASQFREIINFFIKRYSELFPIEILVGYHMKEIKVSKKLSIVTRCIVIQGIRVTTSVSDHTKCLFRHFVFRHSV